MRDLENTIGKSQEQLNEFFRKMHMPYDDPTRQEPSTYIVMESNLLIAEDICGALHAKGACRVIRATSAEELETAVMPGLPVAAAFLEMRFDDVMDSAVCRALALGGAKIVLTVGEDDADAVRAQGWELLVRPFTEEMIHDSLQTAVREL